MADEVDETQDKTSRTAEEEEPVMKAEDNEKRESEDVVSAAEIKNSEAPECYEQTCPHDFSQIEPRSRPFCRRSLPKRDDGSVQGQQYRRTQEPRSRLVECDR